MAAPWEKQKNRFEEETDATRLILKRHVLTGALANDEPPRTPYLAAGVASAGSGKYYPR